MVFSSGFEQFEHRQVFLLKEYLKRFVRLGMPLQRVFTRQPVDRHEKGNSEPTGVTGLTGRNLCQVSCKERRSTPNPRVASSWEVVLLRRQVVSCFSVVKMLGDEVRDR